MSFKIPYRSTFLWCSEGLSRRVELAKSDGLDAFAILGGATLHQAEYPHQFAEPVGEAIGKLQLQDDIPIETPPGILQVGGDAVIKMRIAINLSVQRDAGLVVVADIGFPHISNVNLRLGLNLLGELTKVLQGHQVRDRK